MLCYLLLWQLVTSCSFVTFAAHSGDSNAVSLSPKREFLKMPECPQLYTHNVLNYLLFSFSLCLKCNDIIQRLPSTPPYSYQQSPNSINLDFLSLLSFAVQSHFQNQILYLSCGTSCSLGRFCALVGWIRPWNAPKRTYILGNSLDPEVQMKKKKKKRHRCSKNFSIENVDLRPGCCSLMISTVNVLFTGINCSLGTDMTFLEGGGKLEARSQGSLPHFVWRSLDLADGSRISVMDYNPGGHQK